MNMGKQIALALGFLVLAGTPSFAGSAEAGEVDTFGSDRIYTIYVGRSASARRRCFSYQGQRVVVEGDMALRVYKTTYWTDGNCDLYY